MMRKFCLNSETFELVLEWFTKEKILHDENDNTPVLLIKDPLKSDNRKNMEWVSIRLADAIKYAREHNI